MFAYTATLSVVGRAWDIVMPGNHGDTLLLRHLVSIFIVEIIHRNGNCVLSIKLEGSYY